MLSTLSDSEKTSLLRRKQRGKKEREGKERKGEERKQTCSHCQQKRTSSSHSRQPYKPDDWIVFASLHDVQCSSLPDCPTSYIHINKPHQHTSPPSSSRLTFTPSQNASRLHITAPKQHVMSPSDAIYPPVLHTGFATRSLPVRASYSSPAPADCSVFRYLQRRAALCSQHHFFAWSRTRSRFGFNISSRKCSKLGARRRWAAAVGCRKLGGVGQSLREVDGSDSEQGQLCTFHRPVQSERHSLVLLCSHTCAGQFPLSLHAQ